MKLAIAPLAILAFASTTLFAGTGTDLNVGLPPTQSVGVYSVQGGDIYDGHGKIRLRGVNWFGLESQDMKLHGLWTGRSLESFVDQVQSLGFNAFRIPLAPETLNPDAPGSDGYSSPLAELRRLLAYTRSKGMYVLLDMHSCSKNNSSTNKPGPGIGSCSAYSEDQWINDLKVLAQLSLENPGVVGIDLFNEPYGLTWQRWKALAEHAASAIANVNPNVLIFVEGVANESAHGGFDSFWGENLFDAINQPLDIPASRLVYSPHVYGPSVMAQAYFADAAFPGNMPRIWDEHFGHLRKGNAPLAIGEFGGRYALQDRVWQEAFVDYLIERRIDHFFYWSLNPNSADTGGLLLDDWVTIDQSKLSLLQRLFKTL